HPLFRISVQEFLVVRFQVVRIPAEPLQLREILFRRCVHYILRERVFAHYGMASPGAAHQNKPRPSRSESPRPAQRRSAPPSAPSATTRAPCSVAPPSPAPAASASAISPPEGGIFRGRIRQGPSQLTGRSIPTQTIGLAAHQPTIAEMGPSVYAITVH